jgi:hypothetical protein
MYEGRRLERATGALVAQELRGEATKIGIKDSHELIARLLVAVPPAM